MEESNTYTNQQPDSHTCAYNQETVKERKVKDLTEADEMKKRWQECTEELYKNGHNDQDRDDVGVTHIKPDMQEYEIKWALGSITTRKEMEGDGIPAELFKNPKEWGCKSAAFNMSAIWKALQWPQCW